MTATRGEGTSGGRWNHPDTGPGWCPEATAVRLQQEFTAGGAPRSCAHLPTGGVSAGCSASAPCAERQAGPPPPLPPSTASR